MVWNILTIDVEEPYHGEYRYRSREHVQDYGTPTNIPLILELLESKNVKATFFVVGEIAERFPEVVQTILNRGHEVAFHGWTHLPVWRLTPETFRQEIRRFKSIYPDCRGYRAPSFSLSNRTKWALGILQENRFTYDSSIFPTWTPLYGLYNAPTRPYRPSLEDLSKENRDGGIVEFPLSIWRFLGLRLPIAGGFWLRLFSVNTVRRQIERMNKDNRPAVVYVHNWELAHCLPKLKLGFCASFLKYYNIHTTAEKLNSLLSGFHFTSLEEYMKNEGLA